MSSLLEIDAPGTPPPSSDQAPFKWTFQAAIFSIFLFIAAGFAEICGGWLVWYGRRELGGDGRPIALGAFILVLYGYIPTFQPSTVFARIYAVYGGFFIVLSYLWGYLVDKTVPDRGDYIGSGLALVGVMICWFWTRPG